jgi:hypothetical protein
MRCAGKSIILGSTLFAGIAIAPVAVEASTIIRAAMPTIQPKSNKSADYMHDAVRTDPYEDGYAEGHQHGLSDAAARNCRRPIWWRPRSYYEQERDPIWRQRNLGYFDGYEAAYKEVCKVIRPRF